MIEYRKARAEDAEAILQFTKQVGSETDFLTFGAEGLPYSVEEERSFLETIGQSPRDLFLLVLDKEQLVGTVQLQSNSRERLAHQASLAMSLRKSHWGQKIGSRMMELLLEHAQKVGIEVVNLEVISSNERGIRLYEKFGFVHQGCWKKFSRVGESYQDALIMQCFIERE